MDRRRFLESALVRGSLLIGLSAQYAESFSRNAAAGGSGHTGVGADGSVVVERARVLMGTVVRITVYASSQRHGHHAINQAFEEIARLERLFSVFDPSSDISRINRAAGMNPVRVDPETITMLERAGEWTVLTRGAFDVTVEPCMRLWGFRDDADTRQYPSDREIARTLDAVGARHLELHPEESTAGLNRTGCAIDLGGVAVGYAVDCAVRVLKREGILCAFINHGGDAYALGAPPGSDGWPVMVPHPSGRREPAFERTLRDMAVATSADSTQFRMLGGVRCGHLMDVATARPSGAALSVTVIADEAIAADALSTGLFCLGETRPPASPPGIEVLALLPELR